VKASSLMQEGHSRKLPNHEQEFQNSINKRLVPESTGSKLKYMSIFARIRLTAVLNARPPYFDCPDAFDLTAGS